LYGCTAQSSLTPAGRRLAQDLARSFDAIDRSIDANPERASTDDQAERRTRVRGAMAPAADAAIPRGTCRHRCRDRIHASLREVGRDADMAIRYIDRPRHRAARGAVLLADIASFPCWLHP